VRLDDETPPHSYAQNLVFALTGQSAFKRRVAALGDKPLAAFLGHVARTVPYYRRIARDMKPLRLEDLPIVDRVTMQLRRDEFVSHRYARSGRNVVASTNGTLGPPLQLFLDPAAFYEYNHLTFARIVARFPSAWSLLRPTTVGIFFISDDPDQARFTNCVVGARDTLMRRLPLDRGSAQDRALIQYLRAQPQIPVLYGKPHALLRIADLDRQVGEHSANIRPHLIIAAGENLYDLDRRRLSATFGCPIVNAYTSSEAGLIAVECAEARTLHVVAGRLVAQVLRPDGTVSDEGRGELLITNSINWAQAFVRYRQSDLVTLRRGVCSCGFRGTSVAELSGRDAPYVEVRDKGRIRTPALAKALSLESIKQYEVRQLEAGQLAISVIPMERGQLHSLKEQLRRRLYPLIGTAFTLSAVERITPPGGKLRHFIA
jgi:phenylacetate-coenzyme A ligase PaaK-like adenylate-forming protein